MTIKNIKDKIKEYIFVNSTIKLRVRQIERKVKIPLPSVLRYTKELESEGILKRTIIAEITTFSADRSSKNYLLEKKLFNIKQLYLTGLVSHLIKQFSNPLIIVFGSYSKGEDIEESDIDIYIESPSTTIISLKKFEKDLHRNIHLFNYKDIKHVKNKDLANNILNGIILNGYLEIFN